MAAENAEDDEDEEDEVWVWKFFLSGRGDSGEVTFLYLWSPF